MAEGESDSLKVILLQAFQRAFPHPGDRIIDLVPIDAASRFQSFSCSGHPIVTQTALGGNLPHDAFDLPGSACA
jgi:hypothetical protein